MAVTVFLTWGCRLLLQKSKMSLPHYFPPRKFLIPKFVYPSSGTPLLLLRRKPEQRNHSLDRETSPHKEGICRRSKPRHSKRKFWASRGILSEIGKRPDYAEDGKLNWRIPWAIQSASGISVSRSRHPNTGLCDRGRSHLEPARIYARY